MTIITYECGCVYDISRIFSTTKRTGELELQHADIINQFTLCKTHDVELDTEGTDKVTSEATVLTTKVQDYINSKSDVVIDVNPVVKGIV
jgi:hypothetical protein